MRTVISTTMEVGERELTIDGYVHYHTESNYGADADGNRGEKRTFVDDVTNINAYDADLEHVQLSAFDLEKASMLLTREFLEDG